MDYSRNFGSNFPNTLIPVGSKLDVDNTIVNLIKQYYAFIDSGNTSSANALFNENKAILEPYIINMEYINRLEEEIFNTGLSVLKKITNVVSADEPLDQAVDGWWYQEY